MAENVGSVNIKVNLDDSGVNSQAEKAGSSAGSSFTDALKGALSFAIGQDVFDAVTNSIRSTIEAGWDFDATMQSATTNFSTLLGNASEATNLVNELNSIDIKSPLNMTELSSAAQEMLSFGVSTNDVIPDINELSDVSMGNSQRFQELALAFSQTTSSGKLMGQDLLQYIAAGFNPLQVISQKTGKSMSELRTEMSNGQISAEDVAEAFKDATSSGGKFYDATSNATKTYSGQMDMLKTSVQETLGQMMKPMFNDVAANVLPKLNDAMSTVQSTFKSTGSVIDAVSAGLSKAFGPGVANTFKALATAVKDVFGWLIDHKTLVIGAITGIAGAFAAFKTISFLGKVTNAFKNFKIGVGIIGDSKKTLNDATGTFRKLGAGIGLLKKAAAGGGLKSISADFTTLFTLPPQALIVIAAIGAIAALAVLIITHWKPISAFFQGVWSAICGFFQSAWGVIQSIGSGIQQLPGNIVKFFQALPGNLGYILGFALGTLVKWGIELVQWAASAIPAAISAIGNFFWHLPGNIASVVSAAMSAISKWPGEIASWAAWAIPTAAKDIVNGFKALPGELLNIGKDIVQGLWKGIQDAWGAVTSGVKNLASGFVSGFKTALGIHSPSKVMADEIGSMLPAGIVTGVQAAMPSALDAIQSQMKVIPITVKSALDTSQLLATGTYGLAAAGLGYSSQTVTNNSTKAPVININGNVSLADAGSKRANLQQLQFATSLI